MNELLVSIIIVSFNTKNDLKQCLESLRREQIPLEIFVVDNASQDGTIEMLESEFAEWSALKTIYNDKNVGFTRASNQPISICKGQYILFLNPDTIIRPVAIKALAAYLDTHQDVGIVGPKLVYEDGSLQVSCVPKSGLLRTVLWHVLPYRLAEFLAVRYRYEALARQEQKDVDGVSGACLMIRRTLALELEGFDENFFLSAQDAEDLCARALQKGYRVIYYPTVEIIHKSGRSYKDTDVNKRAFALLKVYEGHLYYYSKHSGSMSAIVLRGIFFLLTLAKGITAGILAVLFKSKRYLINSKIHFVAARKIFRLSIPNAEGYEKKRHNT